MAEKTITTKELSKKTGLCFNTMNTYLCNFEKYRILGTHSFKLNFYFLQDLKNFFDKKIKTKNTLNSKRFFKASYSIQKMLETI